MVCSSFGALVPVRHQGPSTRSTKRCNDSRRRNRRRPPDHPAALSGRSPPLLPLPTAHRRPRPRTRRQRHPRSKPPAASSSSKTNSKKPGASTPNTAAPPKQRSRQSAREDAGSPPARSRIGTPPWIPRPSGRGGGTSRLRGRNGLLRSKAVGWDSPSGRAFKYRFHRPIRSYSRCGRPAHLRPVLQGAQSVA
jgi:hypothetical protein